jgi:hypothetical protein
MFGLFPKPDSKKTTYECLEVWGMLTDRDKKSSAQNILKIVKGLSENCSTGSEAIIKIGQFKQVVIKQFDLRNHIHPSYMQLQIINDYIFSKQQNQTDHAYTRFALDQMTVSLSQNEQNELIKLLGKFI